MADNKSLYEIRLKVTTEDLKKAEREITNFSSNIKNSISKSIESIATGMPKALSIQELWKGVGDVEAGLKKIQNIFPSSGLKPIASLEKSLSSLRTAINKGLSGENLFSSVKKEAGQAINSIQAIERQLDKAFVTKVKKAGLHLFSQIQSENPFTGGRFKELGQTMFSPLTPPKGGREASIIGGLSAMKQFYGIAEPSSTAIYQKLLSKEEGVVADYKKLGATLTALNQRIKELALKPRDFFGDPRELDALVAKYRQAAKEIESVLNIAKSQTMLNNQWLPGVRIGGELVSSRMAKTKAKELSQYYKEMGAEEIKQQKNREAESEKASKLFGAQGYIQERGTFIADLTRRVDVLRNLQNTLKGMRAGTFLKQFPEDIQKSVKDPQKFMQDFISNIGRDLKTAEKQLHGFRKGFSAMTGSIIYDLKEVMKYQTRWYLARALLFAPLQIGAQALKDVAAWQQAMKNVAAVSDYTNTELEKLKKTTIEIGLQTPTSSKEAATALLEFAQAGVSASKAEMMLPLASKMVIATQEDMQTAVSALTTAMYAWKLEARDIPRVADEIAAAMAASKLKVADLSTIFNYLGTTAKQAGMSTRDTLTLITVLSKAGVQPSTIGTGLTQAIVALTKMAPRLRQSLKDSGLDWKEFVIPQNNPLEVFKKLATSGISLEKIFKGFEVRAGRSVAAVINQALEMIEEAEQQVGEKGFLDKAVNKSMEGLINQGKRFSNILTAISSDVFGPFVDGLAKVLKLINDILEKMHGINVITPSMINNIENLSTFAKKRNINILDEAIANASTGFITENDRKALMAMGIPNEASMEDLIKYRNAMVNSAQYFEEKGNKTETDIPTIEPKHVAYSTLHSKINTKYKELIRIAKDFESKLLQIEDYNYKLGYTKYEDYLKSKLDASLEANNKEIAYLKAQLIEEEKVYKKASGDLGVDPEKNSERLGTLADDYKNKIAEINRRILEAQLENDQKVRESTISKYEFQKKRYLDWVEWKMQEDNKDRDNDVSLLEKTNDRKLELMQWLNDKRLISDKTMFDAEEKSASDILTLKKKNLDLELQAFIDTAKTKLDYSGPDAQLDYDKEVFSKKEEYLRKLAELDADFFNNQQKRLLKAKDKISYTYETGGVAGTIGKAFQDLNTEWSNVGQHIYDTTKNIVSGMENSFADFFDYMSDNFMDFENLAKNVLHTIYMELLKNILLKQVLGGIFGSATGQGGLGSFLSGLFPGRAGGGSVSLNTPYIVGESGPELFVPNASGNIIPNNRFGASSAPTLVVNVENKTGKQVKATQSQPQFDGKKWVRSVLLELADSDMAVRSRYSVR